MEVGCSKTFVHVNMSCCCCRPIVLNATVVLHKKNTRISSNKSRKKYIIISSRNWKEGSKKISKKEGTITGAVSLIVGTSIGSGILALPQKTSPAGCRRNHEGLVPSSISLTLCWAFLVVEALLLVEVNIGLLRKKNILKKTRELEIISIRTMAQETLGEWGGVLATVTYVFLGYTSMIAYASKSAEILHRLIGLPESVSGIFFTSLFTILISFGGTRITDKTNQWLTASMISLLLAIEVVAVAFRGWPQLGDAGDWGKVPATIPVMIFAFVYHDLAPVLCAYLGGDRIRIRASILLGSVIPLVALLVWNAIALDLSQQVDQVADPVELLMREGWGGMSIMVQTFSLLAIGTSLLGTLLGFSEFFKEQLNKILNLDPPMQKPERSSSPTDPRDWWARKKNSFIAMAMVIAPSLFVSTAVPDIFSAATDIAGGYCMTLLYGILPPAMVWATLNKNAEGSQKKVASAARPTLFFVGVVASLVLAEQILEDFSTLHS